MSKYLTEVEMILLGGLGCVICGVAALVFQRGYRRGPVGISVMLLLIPYGFFGVGWVVPNLNPLVIFLNLIGACLAGATVFLIPLLTIAGLCDPTVSVSNRLWHAAFVTAAWVFGFWLVLYVLLDGWH